LTNISYFRHKGEIHWRFWSPELVRGVGRRGRNSKKIYHIFKL